MPFSLPVLSPRLDPRAGGRRFSPGAALALLWALGCVAPASAAKVEGYGDLGSIGGPAVGGGIAYEDPLFLDVARELQLSSLGVSGSKLLAYYGEAQFGRIGVSSHISGNVLSEPLLSTGVSLGLGFQDLITPLNLNPLSANFLRLNIGLSGRMTGYGATNNGLTIGHLTAASFGVTLSDPTNPDLFANLSFIEFAWFGDNFFLTNSAGPAQTPRFVPFAGEEPAFAQVQLPGPPRYDFGTRGYIDLPLDSPLVSDFSGMVFHGSGAPFQLRVDALASSSCGNETPTCVAITDFGSTALIGNARIVDANGNLVAGAGFISESGYDYLTPPGPLHGVPAVPEPETWALMLAGLAAIGTLRRRINRSR